MRTTITLDSDVESLLRTMMRERGLSFKDAVNQAIRNGLRPAKPRGKGFVQETFPLGAERNFRWDKAFAEAQAMEDEELMRKMALRK